MASILKFLIYFIIYIKYKVTVYSLQQERFYIKSETPNKSYFYFFFTIINKNNLFYVLKYKSVSIELVCI